MRVEHDYRQPSHRGRSLHMEEREPYNGGMGEVDTVRILGDVVCHGHHGGAGHFAEVRQREPEGEAK